MKAPSISQIDGNGQQYIWVHLEEEKINERGLYHGFKACSIEINHIKQTSTVNEYFYSRGAPQFIRTVRVYKNEIISESELERILKECGLYTKEAEKALKEREG